LHLMAKIAACKSGRRATNKQTGAEGKTGGFCGGCILVFGEK